MSQGEESDDVDSSVGDGRGGFEKPTVTVPSKFERHSENCGQTQDNPMSHSPAPNPPDVELSALSTRHVRDAREEPRAGVHEAGRANAHVAALGSRAGRRHAPHTTTARAKALHDTDQHRKAIDSSRVQRLRAQPLERGDVAC